MISNIHVRSEVNKKERNRILLNFINEKEI